jgi:hypothetical protein
VANRRGISQTSSWCSGSWQSSSSQTCRELCRCNCSHLEVDLFSSDLEQNKLETADSKLVPSWLIMHCWRRNIHGFFMQKYHTICLADFPLYWTDFFLWTIIILRRTCYSHKYYRRMICPSGGFVLVSFVPRTYISPLIVLSLRTFCP